MEPRGSKAFNAVLRERRLAAEAKERDDLLDVGPNTSLYEENEAR